MCEHFARAALVLGHLVLGYIQLGYLGLGHLVRAGEPAHFVPAGPALEDFALEDFG